MKSTQNSNEYGDRKITKNSRDFQTCGCFFRALIWMGLFPSQNRTILIHIWFHIMYPFLFQYQCLTDGQSTLKAERCLFAKDGLPGPLLTVERPTDGHAEGTTGATAVKRRSVTAQTPPVLNDRFWKSVHSPVFFRIASLFCFMGCFSSLCIKWAVVFCWLLMNSLEKYWNCGTVSLEPQDCTRNWRRIAPWRKSKEDATSQSFLLTNQSLWLGSLDLCDFMRFDNHFWLQFFVGLLGPDALLLRPGLWRRAS